ncbi:helix-turn-helix protein [Algoriphagus ratkowskyi]|nr:helix-turn-helix protein [Algoriphagus ratkowskyi]
MLKQWIEKNKLSKTDVAKQLGVTRQQVHSYFNTTNLQHKTVKTIISKFNVEEEDIWESVNENSNTVNTHFISEPSIIIEKGINDYIPLKNGNCLLITFLVEEYAHAGFISRFTDQEFLEKMPNHSIVVDRFPLAKHYSFRVIGESMNNGTSESIISGAIVTAREINKNLWNSRFHINRLKDYVIVHKKGIIVNRITEHDTNDMTIICMSLNGDKKTYPEFPVNLDECIMLLQIVNVYTSR